MFFCFSGQSNSKKGMEFFKTFSRTQTGIPIKFRSEKLLDDCTGLVFFFAFQGAHSRKKIEQFVSFTKKEKKTYKQLPCRKAVECGEKIVSENENAEVCMNKDF